MLDERPLEGYGQRIDHHLVLVCDIQSSVVRDRI
jgi:hypothetical protein